MTTAKNRKNSRFTGASRVTVGDEARPKAWFLLSRRLYSGKAATVSTHAGAQALPYKLTTIGGHLKGDSRRRSAYHQSHHQGFRVPTDAQVSVGFFICARAKASALPSCDWESEACST
jgi:hypothetical protein